MNNIFKLILIFSIGAVISCSTAPTDRLAQIHENYVFADIHAHPSRFHRANIESFEKKEMDNYKSNFMDITVANISTDAAFDGGYITKDGTNVKRLSRGEYYDIEPGFAFDFTVERFNIILKSIENGYAVFGDNPEIVLKAKKDGKVSIIPALEGADGLEGKIENLITLHNMGLRLIQLVHFRDNELGFNQTAPYDPGGLTEFGKNVVTESNRLGIIIDLAHANSETIKDAIEFSSTPIIFSHTGVKALEEKDRHLSDNDIQAIAKSGGMVGIWPTASFKTLDGFMEHIDYVKKLVGIEYVGIASDLRGMSYLEEFGQEANFKALAKAMIDFGYTNEEVGKVMGGNFFRIWEEVTKEIK